jgi:hypothetical protein
MKKILAGLILIILIAIISVYLFIPGSINVKKQVQLHTNSKAIHRAILDENHWPEFWPIAQNTGNPLKFSFEFNERKYAIRDKKINSVIIDIIEKADTISSQLNILMIRADSVELSWETDLSTSSNPFRRFQVLNKSKQLEKDLLQLLEKMKTFFSESANYYSTRILEEKVRDSTLVSTYDSSQGYPSTRFIYGMIKQLKDYIVQQNAQETGLPMLNIFTRDSIIYLTRVAIPVDKKLKSSGRISYKWMLPGGNILVTEVKGGPYNIQKAFQQVENYVSDHQRIAPAIPFQSLVTDRSKEQDTSKWITRIFYPVM